MHASVFMAGTFIPDPTHNMLPRELPVRNHFGITGTLLLRKLLLGNLLIETSGTCY
jgi:hypothetical protein